MRTGKAEGMRSDEIPSQIGGPATRALTAAGLTRLTQLTRISQADLLHLHGVGPKAVRILEESLKANGLAFARPEESRRISETVNEIPRSKQRGIKTKTRIGNAASRGVFNPVRNKMIPGRTEGRRR